MPSPVCTTEITAIRDVAPDVREFTLAPPAEPLSFRPGQWVSLQLPVGERPPLVRAYSFAAPMSPSGELVLCLDRVPDGLGSEYLFSLQSGDELTLGATLGNFVLPESGEGLLWLARFTGIVPFRAMLLSLLETPPSARVTLVFSAPTPEGLPYLRELERTFESASWFSLIATVDEPSPDWSGETASVLDLLPDLVGERRDLTPMICGKRESVRPLRDFFYERGFGRREVLWENYD